MTNSLQKGLGIGLLFFLLTLQMSAQCDPPDLLPTVQCGQAPEVCLQSACYSTQSVSDVGFTGFCGPMTIINNPQFFAFTTTDTTAEIEILVTGCDGSGNNALQSAIIPGCDWTIDSVIVCDNGTGVGGVMQLSYDQYVIGETYYLLIDGSNGAVCEYEIIFTSGVFEPGIDDLLSSATPDDIIACQGQDEFIATADPAIPNAAQYSWSMPWGEVISSSNILNIPIPDDAPIGLHTVCVFAFSGCDTVDMPWPCFDFEIVGVPDEIKPPQSFCPEELPFAWGNQTISGAGDYTQEFNTPEGCPFDSLWSVDVYPDVPVGQIDTVHCGTTMDYEGVTYDTDGTYDLAYPGMGLNGCDSSAMLDVILVDLEGDVEFECANGEFIVSITQLIFQPANATLNYQWYDQNGDIAGETLAELAVVVGGTYGVVITVEVNGVDCVFDLGTVQINPSQLVPPAPTLANGDTIVCPNALAVFEVLNAGMDVQAHNWIYPPDVILVQDDGTSITLDFGNANPPSEICVFADNECGSGEQTCFEVTLIQVPVVGINSAQTTCVDSIVVVSFNGEAGNNAVYQWTFDGGNIVSGTGEGPYEVSWTTPGQKNISVQVAEIGCDTVSAEIQIDVDQVLTPLVNCESTINSITFTWDPVIGATEYNVEVEGQAPFMTTDTSVTLSNLMPGDSATLFVSALGQFQCVSALTIAGCTAQNCIGPTIEITGPDTICLDQSSGTVDLSVLVNGNNEPGTWSGPGIINAMDGIFDPLDATAGPGVHPVIFSYTDANDCTSFDDIVITVLDSLDAAFEVDSVICQSDQAMINYLGGEGSNAVYNWSFDNANINSGNGSGPYALEWSTSGIKQINLSVVKDGCVSQQRTEFVEVKPVLQSPLISCMPNTSSVTFTWNDVPNSTGTMVNLLQGTAGMQNGNEIVFDNLNPGDSIQIELITFSDGICPDLRDTVLCVAQNCPMVTVEIDSISPICLETNAATIALNVDVQNGNGAGFWDGIATDSTTGVFDPNVAGIGTHQIRYQYDDSGCLFSDNIFIVVNELPVAAIGNVDLQLTCADGNEIVLDGSISSPSQGLMYRWSTMDGAFLMGADSSHATASGPGSYRLVVETPDGCLDSTEVTVTQDSNAPTADAGADDRLDCNITMIQIGGTSTMGGNITYAWTTMDGVIDSDTSLSTVMVSSPGTYQILVRNTTNDCESVDQVVITEDVERPAVSASVTDILDCDTRSVFIDGMADAGGSPILIEWKTTEGNVVSGGNTVSPEVDRAGLYTMVVTNQDNGCIDSTDVVVMADDAVISDVVITQTNIRCNGESNGSLQIESISGGTEPYTIIWSNASSDSTIQNLTSGDYTLTIRDGNGCEIERTYTIIEPQPTTFNLDLTLAGTGNQIFEGDTMSVSVIDFADPGSIDSVIWSGISEPGLCEGNTTCSFIATGNGVIAASIVDTNGCRASAILPFEVIVPRVFFIPNVITPNDDNINDFFTVYGKSNLVNIGYMRIFDRWGNVVFERENLPPNVPEAGWNGRLNSTDNVLPGVYVYSVEIQYNDGESEVLKGDVTLLR